MPKTDIPHKMAGITSKNAEREAQMEAAYADFVRRYPATPVPSHLTDCAPPNTAPRRTRPVYLDYTGGSLFAESQIEEHMSFLRSGVFGNPHSNNPTSAAMTGHLEGTRRSVLSFFNASPDEYILAFTPTQLEGSSLSGSPFHLRRTADCCSPSTTIIR